MSPLEIINYLVDRYSAAKIEVPVEESDQFYARLSEVLIEKYQLDVRRKVIECVQVVRLTFLKINLFLALFIH